MANLSQGPAGQAIAFWLLAIFCSSYTIPNLEHEITVCISFFAGFVSNVSIDSSLFSMYRFTYTVQIRYSISWIDHSFPPAGSGYFISIFILTSQLRSLLTVNGLFAAPGPVSLPFIRCCGLYTQANFAYTALPCLIKKKIEAATVFSVAPSLLSHIEQTYHLFYDGLT